MSQEHPAICPVCRAQLNEAGPTSLTDDSPRCPGCGGVLVAGYSLEVVGPAPSPSRRRSRSRRKGRSKSLLPTALTALGIFAILAVTMFFAATGASRILAERGKAAEAGKDQGGAEPTLADEGNVAAIKDLFQLSAQSTHSLAPDGVRVSALAFSPDGKRLLCVTPEGGPDRYYQVLERVAGRIIARGARAPSETVEPTLFAPLRDGEEGGGRLYGPAVEGEGAPGAYLWDLVGGKVGRVTGPPRMFLSLALSPDGATAAAGEEDSTPPRARTRLTHLDSDLTRANPAGPILDDRAATRLRFSDDGRALAGEFPAASGAAGPAVRVWEVPGGAPLGGEAPGSLVALLDGGKVLVTASGPPGAIERLDFRGTASDGRAIEVDPRLGHTGPVVAVAFHPRGGAFATVGGAGEVLVKERVDGTPEASLNGLGGAPPTALAFSPDGTLLAAANGRGRVCIWNLSRLDLSSPAGTPALAHSATGPESAPSPTDGAETSPRPDPTDSLPLPAPKLWLEIPIGPGAPNRGERAIAPAAGAPVIAVKVFDGPRGSLGRFAAWDLGAKTELRSAPAPRGGRPDPLLALSSDGRTLGYGEPEGSLVDIASGAVRPLEIPGSAGDRPLLLDFAPKGDGVLAADPEGEHALVWLDPATLEVRGSLPGPGTVGAWGWSPDGKVLAASILVPAEGRESLLLLEAGSLARKAELERWRFQKAAEGTPSLSFSRDGALLAHVRPRVSVNRTSRNGPNPGLGGARGSWEGGLTLWDLAATPPARRYANDKIQAFAFLGDGLASAVGQAADLLLIDTKSTRTLRTTLLSYPGKRVTEPAISPDRGLRALGISDGRIRLERLSEGGSSPPTEFQAHRGEVAQVAFTHDGAFLVTAGMDGAVKVWSAAP